jgi:SAM-dependent methyltransferase
VDFDRLAPDYDRLLRHPARGVFDPAGGFFHWRKWRVIETLGLDLASAAWLDIGCGRGELLACGRASVRRAAGCDPSAEMLAAATGLDVTPQPDPLRLPYPDSTFDLVTAACVFHHIPPAGRPAVAAEIRRVLRPGGHAVLFEHNPFNPATQWIVRSTPIDADARLLTARAARRLLAAAGCAPLETLYYLYLPARFYARAARLEHALRRVPLGGQYAVVARRGAR